MIVRYSRRDCLLQGQYLTPHKFIFIVQIRTQSKRDNAYNSILCVPLVAPPINERRLYSEWNGATSAAKVLCQGTGNRVPKAGPSRSEAEIAHSPEFSPRRQMRIYCTGQNITCTIETSPQARAIKILLSRCKYGMPMNRNVVFPACAVRECGAEKSHRSSEYHAEVRRGALADLRWP
jgi:hypothetical protein